MKLCENKVFLGVNMSNEEIIKQLELLKNTEEKRIWRKKIINTDFEVLGISNQDLRNLALKIYKSGYEDFLNVKSNEYYEFYATQGYVLNQISDFNAFRSYLDEYSLKIDNWALCDLLIFNTKQYENEIFDLSLQYIKSDLPFQRRIGLYILMNYLNDKYIDKVLKVVNTLYEEEHYYVNMMSAWLLCEAFIKQQDQVIKYLETHKLNKFTINKMISKCRDSYRVSDDDKQLLLKYRIK